MLNLRRIRDWRFDLLLTRRRFVVSVVFLVAVGTAVMYMSSPREVPTVRSEIETPPSDAGRDEHAQDKRESETTGSSPPKESNERKKLLPNALIAGCAKCGTRALLWILGLHPDVQSVAPELHFFDRDEHYKKGLDWYKAFFPPRLPTEIGIEKTPSYFVTEEAPKRIHDMDSSIKIIVIVCEPVRKTISRFAQLLEHENAETELGKIVLHPVRKEVDPNMTVVKEGMYHQHLNNWLRWFPLKQMLFVDGDSFKTNPLSQIRLVEDFLHIPHRIDDSMVVYNETKGFYCIVRGEVRCLGESKGRPHPPTDPLVRQKLVNFYRPHNQMFLKTIGQLYKWDP